MSKIPKSIRNGQPHLRLSNSKKIQLQITMEKERQCWNEHRPILISMHAIYGWLIRQRIKQIENRKKKYVGYVVVYVTKTTDSRSVLQRYPDLIHRCKISGTYKAMRGYTSLLSKISGPTRNKSRRRNRKSHSAHAIPCDRCSPQMRTYHCSWMRTARSSCPKRQQPWSQPYVRQRIAASTGTSSTRTCNAK